MHKRFYTDDIECSSICDDKLSYKNYVSELEKYILESLNNSCSSTMGIVSKWGDGKTSAINMILDEIDKNYLWYKNLTLNFNLLEIIKFLFGLFIVLCLVLAIVLQLLYLNNISLDIIIFLLAIFSSKFILKYLHESLKNILLKNDLRIIKFNPCLSKSEEDVINDFLITLQDEFAMFSSLKTLLFKYSNLFVDNKFINKLSSLFNTNSATILHSSINKYLKSSNKKIIVVIDDLDRMSGKEIHNILKLVKFVANFSNVVYLLAYNKDYVIKQLSTLTEFSLLDKTEVNTYIEKILINEFPLPKINAENLKNSLFEQLDMIVENCIDNYNREDLLCVYEHTLGGYITNLRQMKRFINSFKMHFNVFKTADIVINVSDLLFITAIKVFNLELYNKIYDAKPYIYLYSNQENNQEEMIVGNVKLSDLAFHEINIIKSIFYSQNNLSANPYGLSDKENYDTKRLYKDVNNFDLYFMFNPPRSNINHIKQLIIDYDNRKKDFANIEKDTLFYSDLKDLIFSNRYYSFRNEQFCNGLVSILIDFYDISHRCYYEKTPFITLERKVMKALNINKLNSIILDNFERANINTLVNLIYDLLIYPANANEYMEERVLDEQELLIKQNLVKNLENKFIKTSLFEMTADSFFKLNYGLKCKNIVKAKLAIILDESDENILKIMHSLTHENVIYNGAGAHVKYRFGIIDIFKECDLLKKLHDKLSSIERTESLNQNQDYINYYDHSTSDGIFSSFIEPTHILDALLKFTKE